MSDRPNSPQPISAATTGLARAGANNVSNCICRRLRDAAAEKTAPIRGQGGARLELTGEKADGQGAPSDRLSEAEQRRNRRKASLTPAVDGYARRQSRMG